MDYARQVILMRLRCMLKVWAAALAAGNGDATVMIDKIERRIEAHEAADAREHVTA